DALRLPAITSKPRRSSPQRRLESTSRGNRARVLPCTALTATRLSSIQGEQQLQRTPISTGAPASSSATRRAEVEADSTFDGVFFPLLR
ncbi:unnamed protein product, partial [Amoebophrya sp. A120]